MVDPGLERGVEQGVRLGLGGLAVEPGEGHRADADTGDERAVLAKVASVHAGRPLAAARAADRSGTAGEGKSGLAPAERIG